jgi:hypothetical protein
VQDLDSSWIHRGFISAVIVAGMVQRQDKQDEGEQEGRNPWTLREIGGKPVWGWLELLIVPVVLSLITVGFAWQQNARQNDIEGRRAQAERKLAEQRAQDEALQAYLDQMSTLLIEHDLSDPDNVTTRSAARARTLAVLSRLNGDRKYSVLLFLAETQLVQDRKDAYGGIVPLVGADLSNLEVESRSNLAWNLGGTNLHATDLSNANLHKVVLRETALSNTDLSGANLSGADLTAATLTNAILSNANLREATGWTEQQLAAAKTLKGVTMPDGQILNSDDNPDGPTFEEWLKSKGSGEKGRKE